MWYVICVYVFVSVHCIMCVCECVLWYVMCVYVFVSVYCVVYYVHIQYWPKVWKHHRNLIVY